ncbi:MAG TPA: hypothetical protein VLU47_10255 [Blastocatellia bacterium]|nr:hypothetical protein [Blastocatellia bacterium]
MGKSIRIVVLLLTVLWLSSGYSINPKARAQSERTLAGEWIVTSSPINGQAFSPRGNTLGFPERDMLFEQDGVLRTGSVLREDVGDDVKPLGVWRVDGDRFSATFQLWCPDSSGPCGSIVMRGEFVSDDRIRGTMTAFFDITEPSNPTAVDTWTFNFRRNLVAGSGTGVPQF